ncbi:ABC transporter permease [Streptomyces mirabilis]|uniref:ABC transporter permease n=1 Tax=Streptomyces mirabilis TaxID=68239 RepID=UPI003654C139
MPTALTGAMACEVIKLRSLRSTWITALIAVAFGLALSIMDVAHTANAWPHMTTADRAQFDPVGDSLSGFAFAVLAFGVLGVLGISSEYTTGLIRSTLTATPRRALSYTAKTLVIGGFALLLGELTAFTSFFIGQAVLAKKHLDVGLGTPGVLRAVSCAGLYLFVVTVVGYGLGAVIRHTAGAIAALFALVYLGYGAAKAVEGWSSLPSKLMLSNAADTLGQLHPHPLHPERTPSLAFALFDLALYLALALTCGAWRFTRDAS